LVSCLLSNVPLPVTPNSEQGRNEYFLKSSYGFSQKLNLCRDFRLCHLLWWNWSSDSKVEAKRQKRRGLKKSDSRKIDQDYSAFLQQFAFSAGVRTGRNRSLPDLSNHNRILLIWRQKNYLEDYSVHVSPRILVLFVAFSKKKLFSSIFFSQERTSQYFGILLIVNILIWIHIWFSE
jgi:hypothetical protein